MEGSSNSDGKTLKSRVQPLNVDLSSNSDDGDYSFVSSMMKKGYQSPLSSWDSESETDIPCVVVNCDGVSEGSPKGINLEENYFEVENTDDGLLWEMDNKSYDELLKKFNENEEKLRAANLKVRLLEEEIIEWKDQVENSDDQLVNVYEKLKLKEKELDKQKEVSERKNSKLKLKIERAKNQRDNMQDEMNLKLEKLKKEVAEMDTRTRKHVYKITNLVEQLKVADDQLKISKAEIVSLKEECGRKSFETDQLQGELRAAVQNMAKLECFLLSEGDRILVLEDMVSMYEAKEADHELQMQKLKAEMLNSEAEFSSEQDELLIDIDTLSEKQTELCSKLEDFVSRNNELEDKLKQYEAEKLKQEELHATHQMVLQDEISSVREELSQRKHDAEAVKKKLDKLMAERDESYAMNCKFKADISYRDDQISDMTKYIHKLTVDIEMLQFNYKSQVEGVGKNSERRFLF